MSLKALIDLANKSEKLQREKFDGKLPINREIEGYSKGYWYVRYTFKIQGGYSYEFRWEQEEYLEDPKDKLIRLVHQGIDDLWATGATAEGNELNQRLEKLLWETGK